MEPLIEKNKTEFTIWNVYFPTEIQTIDYLKQQFIIDASNNNNLIEVPFEQYEAILTHMQTYGLPMEQVTDVIKKGAFTYSQVRHIAKAGNIHEIVRKEDGRIELKATAISMSVAISFAQSKWNGADRLTAVKNAVYTGILIFGESFAEDIIIHELDAINVNADFDLDTGVTGKVVQNGTKAVAKKMATTVTKKAMLSSAIAKKTIMMLNANVVTGALVTGVMSTIDIVRAIKGELSPKQLFKNVTKTSASVAGGIIGMLIFGGIGFTVPSVSTAVVSLVGGVIGLIIGSLIMTKIASKILDFFIQDDSVKMLEIFNDVLLICAQDYVLNEEELKQALHDFNSVYDMKDELRSMFASDNRENYATSMIDKELSRIVRQRMFLHVPSNREIYDVLEHL